MPKIGDRTMEALDIQIEEEGLVLILYRDLEPDNPEGEVQVKEIELFAGDVLSIATAQQHAGLAVELEALDYAQKLDPQGDA